jgi:hypothetical protein
MKSRNSAASAPGVVAGFHLTRDHVERGEQGSRAVSLIAVAETVHSFAVGQTKVALGSLQRLYMRLLVNTDDHRVLRRIQVEANHVGGLRAELRVCCDAPAAPPLELNAATAQNAPYLVLAYVPQSLRQQLPVPLRKPFRR